MSVAEDYVACRRRANLENCGFRVLQGGIGRGFVLKTYLFLSTNRPGGSRTSDSSTQASLWSGLQNGCTAKPLEGLSTNVSPGGLSNRLHAPRHPAFLHAMPTSTAVAKLPQRNGDPGCETHEHPVPTAPGARDRLHTIQVENHLGLADQFVLPRRTLRTRTHRIRRCCIPLAPVTSG